MKRKRHKLPRVAACPEDDKSIYNDTSLAYALVSSPKAGRQQIHRVCTCKDYLHEVVRASIHNSAGNSGCTYINDDSPKVDMRRLRLLLTKRKFCNDSAEAFKKNIFAAKAVLNVYEKHMGWKLSKISTVVHDSFDHAWLLTGPPQWIRAPYMLSLAALILRLGGQEGPFPAFNNVKQVQAFWKKLCRKEGGGDIMYMSSVWKKLPVLFENYDRLFKEDPKVAYPKNYSGWFHSVGGIVNLCNFTTKTYMDERFKKLCRNAGVA